jgi:alkylhydroperoxidase/carboxymuconolactone decarboxylase family protein YurZ
MQELTTILSAAEVDLLRVAYDPKTLLAANAGAFARIYPRLAPWPATVGKLCFESSPLAPRDRELALISLLTQRSPGLSMSNHIYWGLMEGVTVVEICEVIGLVAQYCGMPTYTTGVMTLQRTLLALKRVAANEADRSASHVLSTLVTEFSGQALED